MLVGDGFAVVLDFVWLASEHHNDVLAFLDHCFQGFTVSAAVIAYLQNNGVEVTVLQLFGKCTGITGFVKVKPTHLGIICTAVLK